MPGTERLRRASLVTAWVVLGGAGLLWALPDAPARLTGWWSGEVLADCDPAAPPCTVPVPGGGRLSLAVSPADAPPDTPVILRFTAEGPARVVGLRLTGVDMPMGVQHPELVSTTEGWTAELRLAACTMAAMRWRVDATLEAGGQASFIFTSHRGAAPARVWDEVAAADAPTWPAFALQTATGEVRSDAWPGEVVLVYFGYTACPDVCPTTLAALGAAVRALPEGEAARVHGLFVTLDPDRDGLERLGPYTAYFHPAFVGGQVADVAGLSAAWGVSSRKVSLEGSGLGYAVDHGTESFLVRPDGGVERIPHGEAPEAVTARIRAALGG